MGLISYTNLEDNTPATANSLNERFGAILAEVNGNLTAANLANLAVTTPKIADQAVTSSKLNLASDVDANGWTYFSLGNFKFYVKSQSVNTTGDGQLAQGAYRYGVGNQAMPVGVNQSATFWMGCTYTAGIQFVPKPYWADANTLSTMVWNVGPSEYANYTCYWMIIQRV